MNEKIQNNQNKNEKREEIQNKKRQRSEEILPNCLVGQTPKENYKRRIIEKFSIESNIEDDERRIEQRLKQIKFGKNTIGYDHYLAAVPKDKRRGYSEHPRTPDPYEKVTKRAFDGKIKAWRRLLHQWDLLDTKEGSTITSTTSIITNENNNQLQQTQSSLETIKTLNTIKHSENQVEINMNSNNSSDNNINNSNNSDNNNLDNEDAEDDFEDVL